MRFLLPLTTAIFAALTLSAQSINFNQHIIANGLFVVRDVKLADMDNDGDLDILTTGGGEIDWFNNIDGKGNFDSIPVVVGQTDYITNVIFAADIDNNGTMDVLAGTGSNGTNSGVSVFKNLDTLGLLFSTEITLSTLGNEVRDVYAADFDGDDDLDIVYASYDTDQVIWLKNTDGQATYGAPQIITSAANGIRYLTVADADGDNDLDIFISTFFVGNIGQFSWYENTNGLGSFTHANVNDLDGNNAADIAVGDLNGDNAPDVVGCLYNSSKMYWYKNTDSLGTFSNRIAVNTVDLDGPYTVQIVDLDGDGDNDLIVATEKDSKLGYFLNNGAGVFSPVVYIPTNLNFADAMFSVSRLIATGDVDGDGDPDIAAISSGSNQLVLLKSEVMSGTADPTYAQAVHLYPNPARDQVFLEISNEESSIARVDIADLQGRILNSLSGEQLSANKSIPLSTVPTSVLMVTVFFDNGTVVRQKLLHTNF